MSFNVLSCVPYPFKPLLIRLTHFINENSVRHWNQQYQQQQQHTPPNGSFNSYAKLFDVGCSEKYDVGIWFRFSVLKFNLLMAA